MEHFNFNEQIERLDKADMLYLLIEKFGEIDLHPERVSNLEMGYIFEELIRRFSEQSNEDAGEHFSPREIIRLMVNLLFAEDKNVLKKDGIIKTLYDPAAGTGGMLSVAQEYLNEINPSASLNVFGQELNPESYAICKADMLIKGENISNIKYGNSFSDDGFPNHKFDYMLSNPPFGVDWKKVEDKIRTEHEQLGFAGRFGAGLPRIDNGSFLFLQHMISKMKKEDEGSRIAIVYNGGTLFVADHASGENNIRRWIIENDWLEAVIALPNQLFYNVSFYTYIWVISNNKKDERKGKVQLIDATESFEKMMRSLGNKRNRISNTQIEQITKIYTDFADNSNCHIVENSDLGYKQVIINVPERRNFATDDSRLAALVENKAYHTLFKKMTPTASIEFLDVLKEIPQDKIFLNKEEFKTILLDVVKTSDLEYKLSNSAIERIIVYLSELDGNSDIYLDAKGEKKSDLEQRFSITVPANTDIKKYFENEFEADYPDAWYDEDKIKIIYAIDFDKYFFKYKMQESIPEIKEKIANTQELIDMQIKNISKTEKMKPYQNYYESEINWLGRIPFDWNVIRFKNATDILRTGFTGTTEYVEEDDDGVALLSAQNIKNGKLDLSRYNFVSRELYKKITKNVKPQKDDLLQVRVGNENTIVETCVIDEEIEYAVYSSAAHIRPAKKVYAQYLKHLCNSVGFKDEAIMTMKTGVGVANLNVTDLANIKIPLPNYNEQVAIANFLNVETEKVDSIKEILQEQIDNLEKYKKSLIGDCVTGKAKIEEDGTCP